MLSQRVLKQNIHDVIHNRDLNEHLFRGLLEHALPLGIEPGKEFLDLHIELEICLGKWFIELKELGKV